MYLLNLYKEGEIDDSALNKALNALQPSTQNRFVSQDEPPVKSKPTESSKVLDNIRQKRREKKSIKNKDIQRHEQKKLQGRLKRLSQRNMQKPLKI